MLIKIGSIFLISFLISWASLAAPSIILTVPETNIGEDDTMEVTVSISELQELDGFPVLHQDGSFDIRPAGTSASVSYINGVVTNKKEFLFQLTPKKRGLGTLGPAEVVVEGKKYQSNTIVLKVSEGHSQQPSPSYYGYGNQGAEDEEEVPKEEPSNNAHFNGNTLYFVDSSLDKKSVVVGEQLVYTFKFYQRIPMSDAKWDEPKFEGFVKEELGKQRRYQVVRNGVPWNVIEVKYALFPTSSGRKIVKESTLTADAILSRESYGGDSIFDALMGRRQERKRVKVVTKPITVDVSPLPSPAPANYSGFIGDLTFNATLSNNRLSVGEATTLTLTFKGSGNIRTLLPAPISVPDVKTYEDKPEINTSVENGIVRGSKVFKIALVPQKEGTVEIPPLSVSYYSARDRGYKTLTSSSFTLHVTPSAASSNLNMVNETKQAEASLNQKKSVELQGRDLYTIKRSVRVSKNSAISAIHLAVFCFIVGLVLNLLTLLKLRSKNINFEQVKKQRAFGELKNRVSHLEPGKEFYASISLYFRDYIGSKLKVDGTALTPAELKELLKARGVDDETLKKLASIFSVIEYGQYGGGGGDHETIKTELLLLARSLEKEIRK